MDSFVVRIIIDVDVDVDVDVGDAQVASERVRRYLRVVMLPVTGQDTTLPETVFTRTS